MNPGAAAFIKIVQHPVRFRLFLLAKLPSAYLAGVRVRAVSEQHCMVSVPFKWLSQNPFRSTYFACLSMAAEMSTGVLALAHLYKRNPPVSMLVVKVESEYFKKATDRTYFTFEDGDLIRNAIEEAIATGASQVVRARSTGKNSKGELIAEFYITWSFKSKKPI